MALACDITIGKKFPIILSCVIRDGYKETQAKSKTYLGGNYIDELAIINATALIVSSGDMRFFTYWWYEELQRGRNTFTIELPIFGSTSTFTVKMMNEFSASIAIGEARQVQMVLQIQDDIGAILAAELCAELSAIN